jgi:branched-chain amino acid transport system ATP-binding protein
VLRNVSLRIDGGEAVGLVGRNGGGKSTLLRAIAGLLPPLSGSISTDGHDITRFRPEERRRIGIALLAEGRRVFASLTVHETLLLVHSRFEGSRREVDQAVEATYGRFPALAGRKEVPSALLSGGEQQMLCLASALAGSPWVLLIDEPFMGLAPAMSSLLAVELAELTHTGVTMIIADESRRTLERIGLHRILSIERLSGAESLLEDSQP